MDTRVGLGLASLALAGLAPIASPGGSSGAEGSQEPTPARAFRVETRVVFTGAPDAPHRLVFTSMDRERLRLRLELEGGSAVQRVLKYRLGERAFQFSEGSAQSRVLAERELRRTLLQLELRRSFHDWPAGHAWGAGEAVLLEGLGVLRAELDDEGRLERLTALDPDGKLRERFEVRARAEDGSPRTWSFEGPGGPLWEETLLRRESRVAYLDEFFLPADRRPPAGRTEVHGALLERIELPAAWRSEQPLPEGLGSSWRELVERCGAEAAAEARALEARGLDPEPVLAFLLDGGARPRARLRLCRPRSGPMIDPDEPACLALCVTLERPEDVSPALLDEVVGAAPAGSRAGEARLVVDGPPGTETWRLILPLLPAE